MSRPNIRFKEFYDDWEQRKLGNLAEVKDSARIPNDEWTESGVPYIRASDISNDDLSGVLFISKDKYEFYKERTGAPNKNDVLFNGGGEIGKAVLKEDDSPVYVQGGAVLYVRTSESEHLRGDYLVSYFSTKSAEQYIEVASAGGTMKHYTLKPAQNMPVVFPGAEEQEKIGAYFTELDNLIALHQRKCDNLKEVKKYMLQKMFPKNGEKVPEIRFAGFTGDWVQRKLGDVAVCLDNMRVPLNAEEREKIPGDIPYYGAGNIQGYINKHLFEEDLVLLLEDGDAFDDYQTKSIAQYVTGKSWVNNHAHVLRPLGDAYFLYSTLAHKDIRQWTQLAGASRKKLVQEAMLNIDIAVPTEDEQNKVGAVFRELDNLIALYQRKCDNLKDVKKYMLQNMFPQRESGSAAGEGR